MKKAKLKEKMKNENFVCVLHKKNVNEALFVIQERTKFKEINHLILNVTQANDLSVKKYLGALSQEYKRKYEETSNSLSELIAHYEEIDKENSHLKEQIQKDILDKQTAIDNVINEKNKEIIKDSIYNFIIWCNDCHTRMGQVSYYVSLNIGLGLEEDERFIAYTVIDEFEHSPIDVYKPNIIFKVKNGINFEQDTPNYDLLVKALTCTSKKMIPTYLVCNSKTNEEFDPYKLAIMGCRTRVVKDLFGSDTSIGRGNIDNISINLPRLALESMNDNNPIKAFYNRWDKVAETVKDILLDRYYKLMKKDPIDFKLNYERNLWCVDFDSAKNLEEIFKHGTLSIGFIGLSEAMEVLTGKRYYLDDETYKEAISFVVHMREYCDSLIKKYNLNFSLLATSGELISGRFLEIDKKIYSHKIFDKGFYTNSFHVNVDSHLSAFEKIQKEGVFHSLSNGGCISYVELGDAPLGNYEALYELLETAVNSGTSYLGFNFPLDICKDCNCQGVFNDVCPNCNGKNILRIRRVSGYLEILDYFTSGKKNETLTRQRNKWEE